MILVSWQQLHEKGVWLISSELIYVIFKRIFMYVELKGKSQVCKNSRTFQ